ncbi:UTRA domain-containing protein [Enterovibrio norvegicus]|uniref:UTRA domain-containing protein n=1 Tax=Enterovibrio norvegicus TaxID=188144 RepID=UPI0035545103
MQYIKIKDTIVEQIQSGLLAAGTKLPSERKLAESFKTTRVTLREALSLLEAEGVIFREDRRGWFIAERPLQLDLMSAYHIHEVAQAQGKSASTDVVVSKTMMANKEAAEKMALPPFSEIHHIERTHLVDGRPVMYAIHYVRADSTPSLLDHDLSQDLSVIFANTFHLRFAQCTYGVSSTSFDKDIAQALRATAGAPALLIARTHTDIDGVVQEVVLEHWRHNAVALNVSAGF